MPTLSVKYLLFIATIILLSSCATQKGQKNALLYNPKEVAELSQKLGIELSNINKDDDKNMPLYAETSLWMGTPYQYAGLTKKGLDCSGFTFLIFQKVYGKTIPRSTAGLSSMKMHHISKRNLKTGDLVFFATSKNKKKINHVGIYLKDGYFIHASTTRGVTVSHLEENYYKHSWKKGGRLK